MQMHAALELLDMYLAASTNRQQLEVHVRDH